MCWTDKLGMPLLLCMWGTARLHHPPRPLHLAVIVTLLSSVLWGSVFWGDLWAHSLSQQDLAHPNPRGADRGDREARILISPGTCKLMLFTDSYQDTMCPLTVLMTAASAFTVITVGDLEICIAVRQGGAGLNLSILKSPLILFNSIKNWTTAG